MRCASGAASIALVLAELLPLKALTLSTAVLSSVDVKSPRQQRRTDWASQYSGAASLDAFRRVVAENCACEKGVRTGTFLTQFVFSRRTWTRFLPEPWHYARTGNCTGTLPLRGAVAVVVVLAMSWQRTGAGGT